MQIALNIGKSFAELFAKKSQKNDSIRFVKRFYLPNEPLNPNLKKVLDELGPISDLIVSSRFLEKIFATKLGGSVAQVVTSGFESWPVLRQPISQKYFELYPTRLEPLASQDLIFGISERIDSKGNINKALDETELAFIAQKLKLLGTKRVCVNLLHSCINEAHQEQAKLFFTKQGFQVFSRKRQFSSTDEIPSWRVNLLNACLAGSFQDLTEELKQCSSAPIHFLNGSGCVFSDNYEEVSSSLFAWAEGLSRCLSEHSEVLVLDLEDWSWISTKNKKSLWESPWGFIEIPHPQFKQLRVQPTNELRIDFTGWMGFSDESFGYQPGPMSFGKSMKPMVFDALVAVAPESASNLSQVQKIGQQKYLEMTSALKKHHFPLGNLSTPELITKIVDSVVDQIGLEVCFVTEKRKIFVTGFWAETLYPLLKKNFPQIEWMCDKNSSCRLGSAIFSCVDEKRENKK